MQIWQEGESPLPDTKGDACAERPVAPVITACCAAQLSAVVLREPDPICEYLCYLGNLALDEHPSRAGCVPHMPAAGFCGMNEELELRMSSSRAHMPERLDPCKIWTGLSPFARGMTGYGHG